MIKKRVQLIPEMENRKINAMQILSEIESLQDDVDNINPKIIVEIGTSYGGTLSRWFEIDSVETIISIDLVNGIHGGKGCENRLDLLTDSLLQSNKTNKNFYAVNGDSTEESTINLVQRILEDNKVDFLFIDGDHTFEGVQKDFNNYKKFLRSGSLVGFHDIIDSDFHRNNNCYVSTFWNSIKEKYQYKEFIYTDQLMRSIISWDKEVYQYGGYGGIGVITYQD